MGVSFADSVVGGLTLHFALCAIAFLSGCGLLRLLRVETSASAALLAPFLTLLFWTLCLGIGVGYRLPVQFIAPWVWGATLILLGVGLRPAWSVVQSSWQLLLTAALLPVVVMWPCFWSGAASYSGELLPDGWAYVAAGQYFWRYERGVEGGLAELYQYASCLSECRYIASSLLGMLSPLVRAGDTQTVASLFQSWVIFTATSSVACYWLATTGRRGLALLGAAGFAASGWIVNALIANNYDNLLALAYMPALGAAWRVVQGRRLVWALIVGCGVAAVIFTYAELAIVIVGCAALISLPALWVSRSQVSAHAGAVLIAGVVASALLLPFSAQLQHFIQRQMQMASASGDRPGEGFFPGLKQLSHQPAAYWGLGSEQDHKSIIPRNVSGWLLSVCAVVGVIGLLSNPSTRGLGLVILAVNVVAIYMLIGKHYSYASYKFILLGWWLLVGAIIFGCEALISRIQRHQVRLWSIRLSVAAAAVLIAFTLHSHADQSDRYLATPYRSLTIRPFRGLQDIGAITRGSTVVVCVNDWFACKWVAYYLRDTPTTFTHYAGYMEWPIHAALMQRSRKSDPSQARFLLSDHQPDFLPTSAVVCWTSGPLRLWELVEPIPAFMANNYPEPDAAEHPRKR